MEDVMRNNPMTVTSTPTLVAGGLTIDGNQGLIFDGSTDSFSVADSTSMSITGNLTISLFLKLTSTPGSTKTIFDKASSYRLQVDTNRKLLWRLDNGGSNVTVTSNAALTVGQWYHIVCVLNQNPSGTPQFGYTSFGATEESLFGDYAWNKSTLQWGTTGLQNLQVGLFTLPEKGILTDLQLNIKILPSNAIAQYIMGVVYRDASALPGELVAESPIITVNKPYGEPVGGRGIDAWLTLPVSAYCVAGDYWLGWIGGGASGVMRDGYETTGGTKKTKVHSLGAPGGTETNSSPPTGTAPNPFGTPGGGDSRKLSVFANYTAIDRTGLEGKAYIYINGAVDNSANYTSGIADNANAFTHATTDAAVSMDELAIWNRVLSTVEVTNLYRMR